MKKKYSLSMTILFLLVGVLGYTQTTDFFDLVKNGAPDKVQTRSAEAQT